MNNPQPPMAIVESGIHLEVWFMGKYARFRFVLPVPLNHLRNIGIQILNKTDRQIQYKWSVCGLRSVMGRGKQSGVIPADRKAVTLHRTDDDSVSIEIMIQEGEINIQGGQPYMGVVTSQNSSGVLVKCALLDGCGERCITQGSTFWGSSTIIDFPE
jgi:hypothetical protein